MQEEGKLFFSIFFSSKNVFHFPNQKFKFRVWAYNAVTKHCGGEGNLKLIIIPLRDVLRFLHERPRE